MSDVVATGTAVLGPLRPDYWEYTSKPLSTLQNHYLHFQTIIYTSKPLFTLQNHYLHFQTIIYTSKPLSTLQNHYLHFKTIIYTSKPLSTLQKHYLHFKTIIYTSKPLFTLETIIYTLFITTQITSQHNLISNYNSVMLLNLLRPYFSRSSIHHVHLKWWAAIYLYTRGNVVINLYGVTVRVARASSG